MAEQSNTALQSSSTLPSSSSSSSFVVNRATSINLDPSPACVDRDRDADKRDSGGEGVVVVGFLGNTDAAPLINKIIDANIFGSGHKGLLLRCFRHHRITYYHHEIKGILFLHLSSSPSSPLIINQDEFESDHLRGMLFMFSVCHVIIFLHEGLRFDTVILKQFWVLQAAKHALSPFIRSQITPKSKSVPVVSSSISPPAGRRTSQHSSSISLMSGSASRPSALPGQCAPVILFVFVHDSSDDSKPSSSMDDLTLSQSNGDSGFQKSSSAIPGSGSMVMLSRPISKNDAGFRKKLLSSLDAQLRFLIKKCRILAAAEPSLRGLGNTNALPLFSLDASRVVLLINRSLSKRAESLDFVTASLEDNFFSVEFADEFFVAHQLQAVNHEEIQNVKDFIYRHSDILRGRGGLPSNANSGVVAGVGVVAAAAAAAAAAVSAAAGKPVSAPELPSLDNWLSSSIQIIDALLSVEHRFMNLSFKGMTLPSSYTEMHNEETSRLAASAAEAAASCLENSTCTNMKFSVSWCKKVLPAAKEIYLKDLPACYPSSLHNAKLEKALSAFHSMVRGPAVETFTKKLEDECTYIWKSGRQLCDAISLTGKPCMHQRHTDERCDSAVASVMKEHSSGYFFLHACACGRSRHLRDDPFDFDNANLNFNFFCNCEDALPSLLLPTEGYLSPLPPTSWRLLRLGGAQNYESSKGLLQVGFCSKENHLSKWTISLDKQQKARALSANVSINSSMACLAGDPRAPTVVYEEKKNADNSKFLKEVQPGGSEHQRKTTEVVSSTETNISFGRGLPSFTMRKPFSEVVAGTSLLDSTFPNLTHNKQQKVPPAKEGKQTRKVDPTDSHTHKANNCQGSQGTKYIQVHENLQRAATNYQTSYNPFLQIGSNFVPVNMCNSGKVLPSCSQKLVTVYVGFEHECSCGHRFLLSPKHLMEFDSLCRPEVSETELVKTNSVLHEQVLPFSFGTATVNNTRKINKSTEIAARCSQQQDVLISFSGEGASRFQSVPGFSVSSDTMEGLEGSLFHVRLDDGDSAISLLNKNLPVYMNCPHCKSSSKHGNKDIQFASTVSQLQRIFLVQYRLPYCPLLCFCILLRFKSNA